MKKIIATVLAMVMALALCTTAFADTQNIDADKVSAVNADGTVYDLGTVTSVVKTLESKSTSGTTVKITPAYYTINGNEVYTECDKSIADCLLVIKGVGNVYVIKKAAPTDVSATATLYTAPDDETCNKVGKDGDTYVVLADGTYHKVDKTAANYALVNGKLVAYATDKTSAAEHKFAESTKATYASDGKVTSVKCTVCEEMIAVQKTAGSFDGKSYAKITAEGKDWNGYYYVVGTTGVADNTNTNGGKDSPKTFDAGIAMYVGMALTSVAGSAVVIGKKKEF